MTCQNPVLEISNKFLEVDNFLDFQQQLILIKYLLHPSFPWALTTNAVNGVTDNFELNPNDTIGMFHTFLYNGEICSPFYNKIDWVFQEFEKIGLRKDQCLRARAGLFFKHPDNSPHPCHVDFKLQHTTAVYYVNDCDGDLLIYNETYKSHPWLAPLVPTEISRFRPNQGKLAVFDGAHYHSSSYPIKKSMRLAITFNFLSKEDQ